MDVLAGPNAIDREPVRIKDAAHVVVFDDFGNPIWVLQRLTDGAIFVSSVSDASFRETVKALNLDLRVPELKPFPRGKAFNG